MLCQNTLLKTIRLTFLYKQTHRAHILYKRQTSNLVLILLWIQLRVSLLFSYLHILKARPISLAKRFFRLANEVSML